MEHVVWSARPKLRAPVLVAAFAGWNDAGEAATSAISSLAEAWSAREFAHIDPEEYYDFSTTRPQVRLRDGVTREIVWPQNRLWAAAIPGARRDAILLNGIEPGLRWRSFCAQITGVATELGASLVVTLGALLAEVPHRRPVSIIGTASDTAVIEQFGLQRSRYEGPTGIVGVLQEACGGAQLPSASLWAAVPAYAANTASPKASLALVERACELMETSVPTVRLELDSARYEREIDEQLEENEELRNYVARLEQLADAGMLDDDQADDGADDDVSEPIAADPETADQLVADIEQFLRDQSN